MGGDDLIAQTVLSSMSSPNNTGRSDREIQEGDVLGNYQLERLLGEGSMGRVFQARHVRLGRQVALKVLRPEHARDSGFVRRFFQEARSVNQINHEHIVEIFDFVEEPDKGLVYCVMELLRGQSLAQVLKEDRLTLERIQRIGVQVCAALGAAHALGVVHRDVKPDNLFLTHRSGMVDFVKVLDFGVAKILTSEGTNGTLDGTIIGTPTYMAPEQAAGLPVDHRADIYAVGNLLYELLAGHPPFQAPAFGQLVVQIITQPPPALPDRLASGEPMPPSLAALVLRCLAKEPEARPQKLAEVTTALLMLGGVKRSDVALDEDDEDSIPTRRMKAVKTSLLRHRRAPVLIGGMAMAMLAGGLTWRGLESLWRSEAAVAVAPAPAPEPVTLDVRTVPAGARVVRADTGEPLGVTPLVKQLPRSNEALGLRVELAGHVSQEREVRLDANALLEVPLAKVPAPAVLAPVAPPSKAAPAKAASRKDIKRDELIDPFAM
ncbi:serine/threonine-protein kinase [Stigmatella aurantiaca]|uniref:Serine/threonine protein kinase n=2 Tax=Stigmatella aurantiaca (strain DW4/3-1) TaxID=378806 RepID=E3FXQ6_STIAD|nr:serine/threonine-protein kinase [Stigmatella aurantiaca]ADO74851.1 Serine/threonine protein kinase [Stigmatella aurantiaca DW4/3-1]